MSMACLSVEARQLELGVRYHEHQARLTDWISFLLDRATAILSEDTTCVETVEIDEFERKKSRVTGGLRIAAQQLFLTAMRLSKEQVQAAQTLMQMDFTTQVVVADTSAGGLAREQEAMRQMHARREQVNVGKPVEKTGCDEVNNSSTQRRASEFAPKRAAEDEVKSPLSEPLAREAEKVFANLSGAGLNDVVRRERRRRAKELQRARKR